MSVKDLITAIASGSAIETETAFNQVMAEKISTRLEDLRIDVAKSMFGEAKEVVAEDTEQDFVLEDFSDEELQEYMMSEDYEQLDELSKNTLANYVHAAGRDKEERTRHAADLRKADDDLGNASFAASSRHVTNPKTRADAQNAISAARSEVSKAMNKNDDKKFQRGVGIRKALKKLSK